ncbi:hypothetical protein M6B38_341955 [Iris pallida]|uniref:Uncharacterized protein n=1 Tax=Iris pallida TaxID=29817 RepID=A0AAX6GWC2_IRIPA|nr:hypothetical protein M6B38_341955 [Iris pallida]
MPRSHSRPRPSAPPATAAVLAGQPVGPLTVGTLSS